jgi:BirA family biotin operon repressor/biotin-[acetyl-CoA-carboxylase] ligase
VLQQTAVLRRVHPVAEVGSTQDLALALAREGEPSGTVVLTDHQRSGRGRQGRRWDDVRGGGSLAMTVLIDTPPRGVTLVPHALGLAVAKVARRLTGVQVVLKWPNDVVVRVADAESPGSRKLAGILVQREHLGDRDVLLAGIGLNVDHRGQPTESDRTCLATLGHDAAADDGSEREGLLVAVLLELDVQLGRLHADPAALLADYRRLSDTIGRHVDVELHGGRRRSGIAKDVNDEGALVVEVDGQPEVVLSGTVRDHRPPDVTPDVTP